MSTTTSKDYLNQLYDSQFESQKEQLTQAYNESAAELDADKEAAEQQKQKNLVATSVEAQRAQKNYAEVQNAYGLTSGTMAQARLAQDNQLQENMTDIRTAYQEADAQIERQRSLLAQQFSSAIREAQANNDLARAQALYELAREKEAALRNRQYTSGGSGGSGGSDGDDPTPEETPVPEFLPAPNKQSTPATVGSGSSGTVSDMPLKATDNNKPVAVAKDLGESSTSGSAANSLPVGVTVGSTGGLVGAGVGNTKTKLTVDQNSVLALGYGPISEARLNELVRSGEVEEYVEGGKIKFRKVQ